VHWVKTCSVLYSIHVHWTTLVSDKTREARMSDGHKTDVRRLILMLLPRVNTAPIPDAKDLNDCIAYFLKVGPWGICSFAVF
jgi:hypothetical protein